MLVRVDGGGFFESEAQMLLWKLYLFFKNGSSNFLYLQVNKICDMDNMMCIEFNIF